MTRWPVFLAACLVCPWGRVSLTPQTSHTKLASLYRQRKWAAIVRLTRCGARASADEDYFRGMALAKLKRYAEARKAFEWGHRKAPRDIRFPTELAGLAFLQKKYSSACKELKQVLRLDPHNAYAANFLATIYALENNLPAALPFWNRIGAPVIQHIRMEPQPPVDPLLLHRAFAFAPGEVLHSGAFLTTQARLNSLGVMLNPQLNLVPFPNGRFDADYTAGERTGWGGSIPEDLISLLRGAPYDTIYPEFFNLRHSAFNVRGILRWDPQKERVFMSVSGPLRQNPSRRFRLYVDGRRENWNIAHTFFGSTAPVTDMHLEKIAAGAALESIISGRLRWTTGVNLSGRTFRNFSYNKPNAVSFFKNGFVLEDRSSIRALLAQFPERRLALAGRLQGQAGRMFTRPSNNFLQTEAGLKLRWFPQRQGADYLMTARLREGRTWGAPPFDDLFILGLERDNNLWLRGTIGTVDGRKGSAPLGRNFTLFNWDDFKTVYRNGLVDFQIGPFFDTGKITDPTGDFGSRQWLVDTGFELKIRVLSGATVELFLGKDLRTGSTSFYGLTSGSR